MQKTSSNDMKALGMTHAGLEQRESIAGDQLAMEDQPAGEVHE
jgi:hypothetical protein